jgi:hypothetical protein
LIAVLPRKLRVHREADRGKDGKFANDKHTVAAREHVLAASIALNGGDLDESVRRLKSAQIHASHSQHRNAPKALDALNECYECIGNQQTHQAAAKLDEAYGLLQGEPSRLLAMKKKRESDPGKPLIETLTFYPRFIEGSYDPVARTVDTIIITEGLGNKRDKHFYLADTLAEAVRNGVFEGAQAYADHPSKFDDANRPERSVRDLIGYYFDSKLTRVSDKKSGKLVAAYAAKMKIQEGCDWVIGIIKEAIDYNKKFPDKQYVGISINADGDTVPGEIANVGQVNKVMSITDAFSADMVTKPARQGGFLKLVEGAAGAHKNKKENGMGAITQAQILEAAAKLETMAEGQEVDPAELKAVAAIVKEAKVQEKFQKDGKTGDGNDGDGGDGDGNDGADGDGTDGEPDADDEKKKKEAEAKRKREADAANNGTLRETDIANLSSDELKKRYPSLYNAALKEAEKSVGGDLASTKQKLDTLQAKEALRESVELATRLLRESKTIPEGAYESILNRLVGLEESEMREAIKGEEKYIASLGVTPLKRAQGNGQSLPIRENEVDSNTNRLMEGCVVEA